MKTCPNCQYDAVDDERYCPNCGYSFAKGKAEPPPYQPTASTVRPNCPACGNQVDTAATTCPNCGHPLHQDDVNSVLTFQVAPTKDPGSYGIGWVLGFFLGLIGILIAMAIDKPETKKGSLHGLLTEIILSVSLVVFVGCAYLFFR